MSQENVEIAREITDAFNVREIDSIVERTSPDCVIVVLRSAIEGEYRGHEGVRSWAEGLIGTAPDARLHVEQFIPTGDQVVVLGRQTGTGLSGSTPFDVPLAAVGDYEAGRMKRLTAYASHAEALEAAGLSE